MTIMTSGHDGPAPVSRQMRMPAESLCSVMVLCRMQMSGSLSDSAWSQSMSVMQSISWPSIGTLQ